MKRNLINLTAVLGLFALWTIPVLAQVVPPHSIVAGFTIEEWTARYHQWTWSQPTNQHPALDSDGSWASHGQRGPVFFVTGGFYSGPQPPRHYAVPQGKYLLIPLVIVEGDNIDTFPPFSPEELLKIINAHIDTVSELHASIDGVPVPGLFAHREIAPFFSQNLTSANNLFSLFYGHAVTGLIDPEVSDGYWLMLEPLPLGTHVIVFGGTYGSPENISYERTDSITVVSTNNSAPTADAAATLTRVISPNNADASVTLDGSRSSDGDQDLLAFHWDENGVFLSTDAVTIVALPVGRHVIHLAVNDGSATSETTVTVEVLTAGEAVGDMMRAVVATVWKSGEKQPLLNELAAARRAFERNRLEQGLHHLELFTKQIAKRLASQDPTNFSALLHASQAIAQALESAPE